jgi:hypothetical protein
MADQLVTQLVVVGVLEAQRAVEGQLDLLRQVSAASGQLGTSAADTLYTSPDPWPRRGDHGTRRLRTDAPAGNGPP